MMISETSAALLARAAETDRALSRIPGPSAGLIVAERDLTTMTDDRFMTIDEVAARLQISPWTVQDHRRRGLLKASRLGRRVRISEDEFNLYVERLRAVGSGTPIDGPADPPRDVDALAASILEAIESGRLDAAIAAACRRGRGGA